MSYNARSYAIYVHGNQLYGGLPYSTHLDAVVAVLKEFGNFDQHLIDAAYLHDVLEDTHITKETLDATFAQETVLLVSLVTDQPGKNREERHKATYPGIALHPKAVTLKLADRIANMRDALANGKGALMTMYRKEYPQFKFMLMGEHHGAMWAELDRLLR